LILASLINHTSLSSAAADISLGTKELEYHCFLALVISLFFGYMSSIVIFFLGKSLILGLTILSDTYQFDSSKISSSSLSDSPKISLISVLFNSILSLSLLISGIVFLVTISLLISPFHDFSTSNFHLLLSINGLLISVLTNSLILSQTLFSNKVGCLHNLSSKKRISISSYFHHTLITNHSPSSESILKFSTKFLSTIEDEFRIFFISSVGKLLS
jgi:hypothetical protein